MTLSSAELLRRIEDSAAMRRKRARLRAYALAALGGAVGWGLLYFLLAAVHWIIV
jgi:hypothetical protein